MDHDGDALGMIHEDKELYDKIHEFMQPKVHMIDYRRQINRGLGPIKSQSIIFKMSLTENGEYT